MFTVVLTAVAFALSVHAANFPTGCNLPGKSALEPVPPQICRNSLGGLHMICNAGPWIKAAEACAAFGLRLAEINDDNVLYAQELLHYCAFTQSAWIAAYNGLNAEPAMMFSKNAVAVRGSFGYLNQNYQAICQDIPINTVTTSVSTTTTVSSGTKYTFTTVTTTVHQHHYNRDNYIRPPIQKAAKQQCPPNKQCRRPNQSACNCCSDACSVGFDGLHVVYGELMSYADARAACARHGWHLADYLSGMTSGIQENLVEQCNLDASDVQFWVRSFEGVSGGDCAAVIIKDNQFYAGFGLTDFYCSEHNYMFRSVVALCQERPPLLTGSGPFEGQINTTTQTEVSTSFIHTPATTETITFTVTRRRHHYHHRHHHRHNSSSSSSSSDTSSSSSSSD